MTERMAHFLTGWVEAEIAGDGARLLNLAARSGLGFWGFSRQGEKLVARCRPRAYRSLRPLARRCGARPRVRRRGGLPFWLSRLSRRKGLVAGALLGAGTYAFLSCFCWGVTVSGAQGLTQAQVLDAARENGLYPGALRAGLNPKALGVALQNDLPGVAWLSVNTDGCFVEVSLRESLAAPQQEQSREWSNLVAARAGVVVSVEAHQGRPEVRPGDTVEPGQLLVAGLYPQELDPYSPAPEDPYRVLGPARGQVRALTWREFTVQVPQSRRELVPAGEPHRQFFLEVFGLRVPLGLPSPWQGESLEWSQSAAWEPLGRELPLRWTQAWSQPLAEEVVVLSQEEWEQAALLALRREQRQQLPEGSQVVEETLDYSFKNGVCTLRAECRCEEEIGVVWPILVE